MSMIGLTLSCMLPCPVLCCAVLYCGATRLPAWPHLLQVLLMFGPEYARSCGIAALEPLGIYLPGDKNYPGAHLVVGGG